MNGAPRITRRDFGSLSDGRGVSEYTLDNGAGLSLSAINLGGIVTALRVPDRHGTAGASCWASHRSRTTRRATRTSRTIVGRHANRIAQGRFSIDGEPFQLALDAGSVRTRCMAGPVASAAAGGTSSRCPSRATAAWRSRFRW